MQRTFRSFSRRTKCTGPVVAIIALRSMQQIERVISAEQAITTTTTTTTVAMFNDADELTERLLVAAAVTVTSSQPHLILM